MATGTQRALGWKEQGRQKDDFYATPRWATEALLKREWFYGSIWECASGSGAISKVLEENFADVFSSDIRTEGIYGTGGINFLTKGLKVHAIITNPPFKLALPFILHALECADKVAIFGRIQLLEGQKRYKELFSKNPPNRVWVFVKRVACLKNGKEVQDSLMCFCWFVWDKNDAHTETRIGWIYD